MRSRELSRRATGCRSGLLTCSILLLIPSTAGEERPHWSLRGRTAIVTGGSKGLGRAIVEELLQQGCEVLTCARDLSPLAELIAEFPQCTAVAADISRPAGRAILLEEFHRRFGDRGLDLLCNNVGTNLRRASVDYTDEEYDALMDTNQGSAFHLSRACFPLLSRAKGVVVSVSSVSGAPLPAVGKRWLHFPQSAASCSRFDG